MAIDSSPSFIPKQPSRGAVKQRGTRKIYILTYISFVLFFGTLIAAGATFFYKISVESQLDIEKQKLVEQRQLFNQADFERVREFSDKLTSSQKLLDEHVSVVSILDALEKATLSTIQIKTFGIDRSRYSVIALNLEAQTDSFNSVLFQRKIFAENPILQGAQMVDLKLDKNIEEQVLLGGPEQTVAFNIIRELSPSEIPYVPQESRQVTTSADQSTTTPATSQSASADETTQTVDTDVSTSTGSSDVNNVTQ